ncbi:MAG: hypothetical protein ABIP17_05470, partial [Ilumatobacteraceae bacterium]
MRAASIEQHLLACGECRMVVASAAPIESVTESWTRVADVIDRPPRRLLAIAFGHLLPDRYVRPVSATLGLQWAWLASTLVLATGAAFLNRVAEADRLFLSVAPLVAVAVVVVAFTPAGEPGGEAAYATPVFGLGLLLRRLVAALVPALLVLGVVAAFVADLDADSVTWLLPAFGLATTTLALTTYLPIRVAGVTAASLWSSAVIVVGPVNDFGVLRRWSNVDLFDQRGQVVATLVTLVAVLVISLRRE